MWLSEETFRSVVATTPLVSIDLIVQDSVGQILLGERLNRPAQGYWFVPGGRILKNERLDEAFRRLTLNELGIIFERNQARLLGMYEHFYSDCVFGGDESDPDTHYVVLGYCLKLPDEVALSPPSEQHGLYRWWSMAEMETSSEVHSNTLAYLTALR